MKVITIHTDQGQRSALWVGTGRKFHSVILIDNPIRIRKLPLAEERHFRDLDYKGRPYPVKRAVNKIRRLVKQWHGGLRHVSKPVREVLR